MRIMNIFRVACSLLASEPGCQGLEFVVLLLPSVSYLFLLLSFRAVKSTAATALLRTALAV